MTRAARFAVLGLLLGAALGCHANGGSQPNARGRPEPATGTGAWIARGSRGIDGQILELAVSGNRFVASGDVSPSSPVVDLTGYYVVPAFIDSHVHLAYYAVADALPAGGIVGAVDFAAPIGELAKTFPIAVIQSGPMITPLLGYPTQSWGSGGFGLEVASPDDAAAAVDRVLDAGAKFVKTPLSGTEGADDAMLASIVLRAHARGAKVAVHALGAADAARAIASEVDIFGHTPTEPLTAELVDAWGERTVVSTLAAFGSSEAAIENLRAFSERGALVLYGTDLGNTRFVGIQSSEIDSLVRAGLTGSDIVRSATANAARYWGMSELGRLDAGARASLLVLDEDPNANPQTLTTPHAVVFDGRLVAGTLPGAEE
jgi:imidazolonepropionase-like amidohydrolase